MRFLKGFLITVGLVAFIGAMFVLGYTIIEINQLSAVASANRSNSFRNPRNWVFIMAGAASLGCLLLGLGLGIPNQTRARIRELALQEDARKREDEISSRVRDTEMR